MKNTRDFCIHECPYYDDPIACMGGMVCPLKQKKRQFIKNCTKTFGYCFGSCLFTAVITGNWSIMYILPILFIITFKNP